MNAKSIFFLLIAVCSSALVQAQISNPNSEILNATIYSIPPPSGTGTGVCSVELKIYKSSNMLKAVETCGGHDENGHTEYSEEIFMIGYKPNFKYDLTALIDTAYGNVFGCVYFEFKENMLYLYDNNFKVIHDWFCTEGHTPKREVNADSCDCIFLPSNE